MADLPFLPRRMQASTASAYMGVSLSKFLARVRTKAYPAGYHDGGNMLWYREDLDACMDRLKGVQPQEGDEWMEAIENAPH